MSFRGVNIQRSTAPWELSGQTWLQTNFLGLLSGTVNVQGFNQFDWPNPTPVQWLQPWTWNQIPLQGQDTLPHRQQDWPNPTPVLWFVPISDRRVQYIGKDTLPHRQQDWPNPKPVQWYQSWTIRPIEELSVKPFHQHDWPNPKPVLWYQTWERNLTTSFPPPPLPVFPIKPPPKPQFPYETWTVWSKAQNGRRHRIRSWSTRIR